MTEQITKILDVDLGMRNKEFLSNIKISNNYTQFFHDNLYFCTKCIKKGFHSLYHQIPIFKYCPFHPEILLTNKCIECNENFRVYSWGYNEEAYCCLYCNYNALNSQDFRSVTDSWSSIESISEDFTHVLDFVNSSDTEIFLFYQTPKIELDDKKTHSRLFNLIYSNLSNGKRLPYCTDINNEFKTRYPKYDRIKLGYYSRLLTKDYFMDELNLTNKIPMSYLKLKLDVELFNCSKSIFKSVEKYIFKSLNKDDRKAIKKTYYRFGLESTSSFNHPFIIWKKECYGDWMFDNYFIKNYPHFEYREYSHYVQIFPHLKHSELFQRKILYFYNNMYSYSAFLNIFSKVLFNMLYSRYKEIESEFFKSRVSNIVPAVVIKIVNTYSLIQDVSYN